MREMNASAGPHSAKSASSASATPRGSCDFWSRPAASLRLVRQRTPARKTLIQQIVAKTLKPDGLLECFFTLQKEDTRC